jgi:2-methylaconitate isomerase
MEQIRLPATFMRGGTSKAIIFRQSDLPPHRESWAPIFLGALGSPDPNGRQLDGMGGGISSLSKICIVGPPSISDADVDYTFVQASIRDAVVDYSGNCGNMASAIGPFAVDEGLVPKPAGNEAVVRIFNTNTRKIIVARFPMDGRFAAVDGDFVIDGVAGGGAPIRLDFIEPGGAKTGKLLPTANVVDTLQVPGLGPVRATLIDAANPCIFVPAEDIGMKGTESPNAIERDAAFLKQIETIRYIGSVAMGIAPNIEAAATIPSIPRVAWVAAPTDTMTISGRKLSSADVEILVRMISTGQPHRAIPLTGALCLAVACRVPGSVPNQVVKSSVAGKDSNVRIGHPSGVIVVDAQVRTENEAFHASYATVYRTARRLFQGEVFVRAGAVL